MSLLALITKMSNTKTKNTERVRENEKAKKRKKREREKKMRKIGRKCKNRFMRTSLFGILPNKYKIKYCDTE